MIEVSSLIQSLTIIPLTELLRSIVRPETDSMGLPVASFANILVIILLRFLRGSQTCLIFWKMPLCVNFSSSGK